VIAAHLGGGASMCAMLDGKSVQTTMGFAGVSGLPMATRSSDVPPGALFYLLRRKLFDDAALEKMLYERARLLGLSGISGDMRALRESPDPGAVAAVEHFVYAMTKYVGAYIAILGGLDAIVFTAGIGEHSAPVRAALCCRLTSLGVKLDEQGNASNGPRISASDSAVSVWVIPTNEELMIVQHTLALIRPCGVQHLTDRLANETPGRRPKGTPISETADNRGSEGECHACNGAEQGRDAPRMDRSARS
jgi:acetate kinase